MDGGLVTQIINVLISISTMVITIRKNNKKCTEMCDLVDELRKELMPLSAGVTDASVQAALRRLKDTLVRTVKGVKNCRDANALVKFFEVDGTAAKLDQLRQNLSHSMIQTTLIASVSSNNVMHNMDWKMDVYQANIVAFLEPLQSKVDRLEKLLRNSTDNSRNKNKTDTKKKTGLRNCRWIDLDKYNSSSSSVISRSDQSVVYKGKLNNISVAVKEFLEVNEHIEERFVDELRLILKLQHRNIVEFLGYCFEYNDSLEVDDKNVQVKKNRHLCFVSRYMSNESMTRVTTRVTEGDQRFEWPTLFKIIQGIANGIHYLHKERVVHLDLKPKTILLDANMIPKINDLGTAKELGPGDDEINLSGQTIPSMKKYMAPELLSNNPTASFKSDVYSFGVMLLETISNMCATTHENQRRPSCHEEWINRIQLQQESEFRNLFDKKLVTDQYMAMATKCVLVGVMCCLPDPKHRPSMQQVIRMLAGSTGSPPKKVPIKGTGSSTPLPYDFNRTSPQDQKQGYTVMTEEVLKTQQMLDMSGVAQALGIKSGVAELLLRRYDWSIVKVQNEWALNPEKLLNETGLTLEAAAEPIKPSTKVMTCKKCRSSFNAGQMMSAGCSHYYCHGCWSTQLVDEVQNNGPPCVPLRCRSCSVPVVHDLVQELPDRKEKHMYLNFLLWSYVADSGGRTRWCPRPNCGCAIMFDDDRIGVATDVVCSCGHRFCSNTTSEVSYLLSM